MNKTRCTYAVEVMLDNQWKTVQGGIETREAAEAEANQVLGIVRTRVAIAMYSAGAGQTAIERFEVTP